MIGGRSLEITGTCWNFGARAESHLNILERLAEKGCLKNNRQLIVPSYNFSCNPRFVDVICSMENLETLDISGCQLPLEQLPHVFSSCPKLVELHLFQLTCDNWDEDLKSVLRPGFHRLKVFQLEQDMDNNSWQWIQEMLT
jgi:hypothetical protein